MGKCLFTGAQLLTDETQTIRFGMVGAFGPLTDLGTVRFTLEASSVQITKDEDSITIELPEKWATLLGSELIAAATRLDHMRTLHRLNYLDSSALTSDLPDPVVKGAGKIPDE
jgi:hypothetical protein